MNNGRAFGRQCRTPAEYACAVERPTPREWKWIDAACWVAAFVLLGLALSCPWWLK